MTLRIILFAVTFMAGIIVGIAIQQMWLNADPVPCPPCKLECPPATEVNLQTLDMEGLKRIKGDFNYSPSLSNVVVKINCQDSTLLKELLKKAR
jgi:hypothetical protein